MPEILAIGGAVVFFLLIAGLSIAKTSFQKGYLEGKKGHTDKEE